jgi:hypothetical protein
LQSFQDYLRGKLAKTILLRGAGLLSATDAELGDELPIKLAGAEFKEFLKGGAHGGLVLDAELGKFGQVVVIGSYDFVRGLEFQRRHVRGRAGKVGCGVNSQSHLTPGDDQIVQLNHVPNFYNSFFSTG